MRRKLLLAALMFLLSALMVKANGEDDEGNPNDPFENERANACYTGGSWEGKCDTEIEWIGGWYYIRWEAGIFSREDIPAWLWWILPPPTEDEEDEGAVPSACIFPGSVIFCSVGGNRFDTFNVLDGTALDAHYMFPNGTICQDSYNGHDFTSSSILNLAFDPAIVNFVRSKGFAANSTVCTYNARYGA